MHLGVLIFLKEINYALGTLTISYSNYTSFLPRWVLAWSDAIKCIVYVRLVNLRDIIGHSTSKLFDQVSHRPTCLKFGQHKEFIFIVYLLYYQIIFPIINTNIFHKKLIPHLYIIISFSFLSFSHVN